MNFVETMKQKAISMKKRLVLPEGTEPRTVKAARLIIDQGIASEVTLIGAKDAVKKIATAEGVSLEGLNVVDPAADPRLDAFAHAYYEMRKHKGMQEDQAKLDMKASLRFGAMMVHLEEADALVAGAESTTADVLRACLAIIGTLPGSKTASSCFVMSMKDTSLIFSDCAVVPDPDAHQLAEIAIAASNSCREFLEQEPVVALLSFSTKGSGGEHSDVLKVRQALDLVKSRAPELIIDGELQVDSALVPSVTDKKAPGSPVRGKVNTLVFPDLGAGNIGYKLVQRLAGAEAFGPFLQGFAKPVSDLSRGCSVEDIVVTSAVTLARAK